MECVKVPTIHPYNMEEGGTEQLHLTGPVELKEVPQSPDLNQKLIPSDWGQDQKSSGHDGG